MTQSRYEGTSAPANPHMREDVERQRAVVRAQGELLDQAIKARERAYWKQQRTGNADTRERYAKLNQRVNDLTEQLDAANVELERLRGLWLAGRPFTPQPPRPEPEIDGRAAARALFGG